MEKAILLQSNEEARALFGKFDENLKLVQSNFGVKIVSRGERLVIEGRKDSVEESAKLIKELLSIIRQGGNIKRDEIVYSIRSFKKDPNVDLKGIYLDRIDVSSKRQFVAPKTEGQEEYVDAMRHYDIVFGIGPAGTGKTYLAMAMAVTALLKGEVKRIILTRPAIEAGEKLGFLPGDLIEKVNPYLRPLYDAMHDMLDFDKTQKMLDRGDIEVAPLAFMRGRTLNDAYVILDEAQNCTVEQMRMFL